MKNDRHYGFQKIKAQIDYDQNWKNDFFRKMDILRKSGYFEKQNISKSRERVFLGKVDIFENLDIFKNGYFDC